MFSIEGRTALNFAMENKHASVANLLRTAEAH